MCRSSDTKTISHFFSERAPSKLHHLGHLSLPLSQSKFRPALRITVSNHSAFNVSESIQPARNPLSATWKQTKTNENKTLSTDGCVSIDSIDGDKEVEGRVGRRREENDDVNRRMWNRNLEIVEEAPRYLFLFPAADSLGYLAPPMMMKTTTGTTLFPPVLLFSPPANMSVRSGGNFHRCLKVNRRPDIRSAHGARSHVQKIFRPPPEQNKTKQNRTSYWQPAEVFHLILSDFIYLFIIFFYGPERPASASYLDRNRNIYTDDTHPPLIQHPIQRFWIRISIQICWKNRHE